MLQHSECHFVRHLLWSPDLTVTRYVLKILPEWMSLTNFYFAKAYLHLNLKKKDN